MTSSPIRSTCEARRPLPRSTSRRGRSETVASLCRGWPTDGHRLEVLNSCLCAGLESARWPRYPGRCRYRRGAQTRFQHSLRRPCQRIEVVADELRRPALSKETRGTRPGPPRRPLHRVTPHFFGFRARARGPKKKASPRTGLRRRRLSGASNINLSLMLPRRREHRHKTPSCVQISYRSTKSGFSH